MRLVIDKQVIIDQANVCVYIKNIYSVKQTETAEVLSLS